ncbi:metabolite traffic protein EboE [Agromyces mangrovi Wang et al. 2018]|uniref:metabolite traffic protein EboE n=1 Tax=Agromyces mangrovi TaxID=1858653 RepID=UPI002572C2E5|nr:metabolite traffic protein EboE [Agromyces mangrovi]BDZ65229.1 xylose isomerase [Agromyces mangrovi]
MDLSYCTNVHPAETLDGVIAQLHRYAGPIRRRAGLARLGVGLWLPAALARELATDEHARGRLRDALDAESLEVRTLNAFPYAAFHADVVKHDVYRPDWTTAERERYTLDCAAVLADLLPEGATGSISTLPLGWREPWGPEQDRLAMDALTRVSRVLGGIRSELGRTIRLAIEPEPGCVLDDVGDIARWLGPRVGHGGIDAEHVGVCLDTCHLAVSFADPARAVDEVLDAGLRVVKVQASAALHADDPADPATADALGAFAEPRYLHQTRLRAPGGEVVRADDLDLALSELPRTGPWRTHFHMPLHHPAPAPLATTTDVLEAAYRAVLAGPGGGDDVQLDVETYTWSVLDVGDDDLIAGVAGELAWVRRHLLGASDLPGEAVA